MEISGISGLNFLFGGMILTLVDITPELNSLNYTQKKYGLQVSYFTH
jgi:hypothetical protein